MNHLIKEEEEEEEDEERDGKKMINCKVVYNSNFLFGWKNFCDVDDGFGGVYLTIHV